MQEKNSNGLTLEELSKMDGFTHLSQVELEQALQLIKSMTELLQRLNIE